MTDVQAGRGTAAPNRRDGSVKGTGKGWDNKPGERSHPGVEVDMGHDEADHKNETAVFGFWIFLMSDAVIFALLFATWGVIHVGVADGPAVSEITKLPRAFVETMLLLTSTLTCGLASAAQEEERGARRVLVWLGATLALGCAFLVLEGLELRGLVAEGHGPDLSGMLSAFFVLVGTHGLHVSIGVLWGSVLLVRTLLFGLDARTASRLVRFALYWHFLDIVWVAIFSFVYLAGQVI